MKCLLKCNSKTANVLIGEASASTMWDNQAWSYLHRDGEETEPPFLAQDFIHAVQPDAKIIIMLRDPVERCCTEIQPHMHLDTELSDYLLFFASWGLSYNLSSRNIFVLNQNSDGMSNKVFFSSGSLPCFLLCLSFPRLYSDYLYFKMANKSAEDFHQKVVESVHLFQSCLSEWSIRSCVYNTSLSNAMPVN